MIWVLVPRHRKLRSSPSRRRLVNPLALLLRQSCRRCRANTWLGPVGRKGAPQWETICSLVGSYTAFAATKAQREATGDARLSIAERYRNRDNYVNRIRIAAEDLIERGFLLPEDAAIIVQAAAANPAFGFH